MRLIARHVNQITCFHRVLYAGNCYFRLSINDIHQSIVRCFMFA